MERNNERKDLVFQFGRESGGWSHEPVPVDVNAIQWYLELIHIGPQETPKSRGSGSAATDRNFFNKRPRRGNVGVFRRRERAGRLTGHPMLLVHGRA